MKLKVKRNSAADWHVTIMAECSEFVDGIEELITCGICDDILNIPKTLGCLHTFCLKCLERWQQQCQTERKPFNCPTCRVSIRVQTDDVNNLPTSFQHNSLIELLNTVKEKNTCDQEKLWMPCSSCSNRRVVAGCCFQCGGMLCEECHKDTKTERKSVQHGHRVSRFPMDQAAGQQDGQIFQQRAPPHVFLRPQMQQTISPHWQMQQQARIRVQRPMAVQAVSRPVRPRGVRPQSTRIKQGVQPNLMNQVPRMAGGPFTRKHDKFTHSTYKAKQMLGERLFPLIQQTYPELAGKITGMLLELDNAMLLYMLENHEALNAKVEEAVNVLKNHQAKDAIAHDQEPGQEASTALGMASSDKQMLGERLFPLIQQTYPNIAGKITGMLLEMDNAELVNMLESREALNAKVEEAVNVLENYHENYQ